MSSMEIVFSGELTLKATVPLTPTGRHTLVPDRLCLSTVKDYEHRTSLDLHVMSLRYHSVARRCVICQSLNSKQKEGSPEFLNSSVTHSLNN